MYKMKNLWIINISYENQALEMIRKFCMYAKAISQPIKWHGWAIKSSLSEIQVRQKNKWKFHHCQRKIQLLFEFAMATFFPTTSYCARISIGFWCIVHKTLLINQIFEAKRNDSLPFNG